MKFYTKLFLGIMVILTVSLAFAEYYTVFNTFRTNIEHETDNAMRKHQLVKYALQADLVAAGNVDTHTIDKIAERTRQGFDLDFVLRIVPESSDFDYLYYSIIEKNGEQYIVVSSCFQQNDTIMELESTERISYVFLESKQIQQNCKKAFAEMIVVGLLLAAVLSSGLTYPIKRLNQASRAYTNGNYESRVKAITHDEVGELTESFNKMADSINEKINALELAVTQREDFVASFAHELKTPMTSIIGYADTLYQREMSPEQVQESAGYILNEGLRLEALSFKLLELITLERQEFMLENMNLQDVIEDIKITAMTAAENRGIELSVTADEGYAKIEFDLFKTMLLNLIDNSTKSGGTKVIVTGIRENDLYYIMVEDDGRGIPEEELNRITEAFYMVDKSRSRREHGAGLGLALCEKIATIHGTHLCFESKVDEGTCVWFSMPICEEDVE